MAFEPKNYDSGKTASMAMAASSTIVRFDALAFTSWLLRRATSSDTEVRYVALESKTTSSGETPEINVVRTDGVKFIADTAANTAQANVDVYHDLTDHDTLNNAASSSDVFYWEKPFGAAADKKLEGFFVMKTA